MTSWTSPWASSGSPDSSASPADHRLDEAAAAGVMGGGADAVESYFECISTCSLDDGECITVCTEMLRNSN